MNPLASVKKLTRMVFRDMALTSWSGWGWSWGGFRSRGDLDVQKWVGDGTGSSTVMAPMLYVANSFPEAPPILYRKLADGQEEPVYDHKCLRLLERPNEFYTYMQLMSATLIDWYLDGNAYWLKVRERGSGILKELWWVPHYMMTPRGSRDAYIDYYDYTPNGYPVRVPKEDVVHLRFGLDPEDSRKGYSRLKSVIREVYTDDEAARFTAGLLRNTGVPGLIVSPDANDFQPSSEDVNATKEYMKSAFTGDRRGEPLVMSGPTKVQQFGFSPEQLTLRDLRRIPEERVTALMQVPAIVAGLGAGLDRSTFTNMGEAREFAYESGIIPTQRFIGEDVRFQLLNEFVSDVHKWRFGFDLSKVRVLKADEDALARRMDTLYRGGIITRAESRKTCGFPVEEERDDVFQVPVNLVLVRSDGTLVPTTDQALAAADGTAPDGTNNGNGNGNGGADGQQIAEEVVRAMERQMRSLELAVVKSQPVVNFHENAFSPPQVTVEAAKAPDVTVEPRITVQPINVEPLAKAIAANGNGKRHLKRRVEFSDGRTATIEVDDE